jgi:hypothetical protein
MKMSIVISDEIQNEIVKLMTETDSENKAELVAALIKIGVMISKIIANYKT